MFPNGTYVNVLIYCIFILEHHVQVIFSLEWQNELIKSSHYGVVDNLQSKASHGHYGRDKIIALLNHKYYIPLLRERVTMMIKYCEPCQCNNTRKLDCQVST